MIRTKRENYCDTCGNKLGYKVLLKDTDIDMKELKHHSFYAILYSTFLILALLLLICCGFYSMIDIVCLIVGKIDSRKLVRKQKKKILRGE